MVDAGFEVDEEGVPATTWSFGQYRMTIWEVNTVYRVVAFNVKVSNT